MKGTRSLPENPPDCTSLYNSVCFYNFKFIVDELFAEALRSLKTCLLVNNILCGKLLSSLELPITFDERF